jgi:hypothetical protein
MPEYVEILTESREIRLDLTSSSQTIAIQFKLPLQEDSDELEVPEFYDSEFMEADDDVLALEIAYSLFPPGRWLPNYNGDGVYLVLSGLHVKQVSNSDWWSAVGEYKFDTNQGQGGQPAAPDAKTLPFIKIGFAGGGNTTKITQSLEITSRVSRESDPRPLPCNVDNAIGVTEDSIEGADVYAGGMVLNITAYYFPNSINEAFLQTVANLFTPRNCVNSKGFLGFAAGEALLVRMTGDYTLNEVIPITFEVDIKKNISGQADPPFTSLTMTGHQLLDYRYLKEVDECGGMLQTLPAYRFIHTVYRTVDFDDLGFPTSLEEDEDEEDEGPP